MDDVGRKHGNIMVSTFRKIYGDDFAKGFSPTAKLSTTLETLDKASKTKLMADAKAGTLDDKVTSHSAL